MQNYAVLTGDLISSSDVPESEYDTLLYTLNQTLLYLSETYDGSYSVFRGDAFQLVIKQINHAFDAALLLRMAMRGKSSDCRICIGIGTVSNLRDDVQSSTGQVFTLSGKGLDNLTAQHLDIKTDDTDFQHKVTLLVRFADVLIGQVTARQAEAYYAYLTERDKSHQSIANTLKTSRVNATRLLNQSHYGLLGDFLVFTQSTIEEHFYG